MEDYATSVAVTPPESLKNSILAKIRELEQESAEPKISVAIPSQEKEVEEMPETKIIPISGIYKWSAAASVLVIIGLSLLYLNSATKANGLEQDLTALEEKADKNQETLEDKLLAMQSDLYAMQEREAFINAPNTQKLLLQARELNQEQALRRILIKIRGMSSWLLMDCLNQYQESNFNCGQSPTVFL